MQSDKVLGGGRSTALHIHSVFLKTAVEGKRRTARSPCVQNDDNSGGKNVVAVQNAQRQGVYS